MHLLAALGAKSIGPFGCFQIVQQVLAVVTPRLHEMSKAKLPPSYDGNGSSSIAGFFRLICQLQFLSFREVSDRLPTVEYIHLLTTKEAKLIGP